jgi:hypothetical protein
MPKNMEPMQLATCEFLDLPSSPANMPERGGALKRVAERSWTKDFSAAAFVPPLPMQRS